jgi:hypothetical protein
MPPVDKDTRNCVIHLYRSADDAWAGARPGGIGFLLGVSSGRGAERIDVYAVTNGRVVRSGYPVIRFDAADR